MDLVVTKPSTRSAGPAASRIALFENWGELFVAREEGAISLLETASRPTLAIDARQWFDVYDHSRYSRIVGVDAKWYTQALRPPAELWKHLEVALVALRKGERVILFCEKGKHRSFQLCLYLLSPFLIEFWTVVDFVQAKRPIVEPSNLPRLRPRAISAWLVFK